MGGHRFYTESDNEDKLDGKGLSQSSKNNVGKLFNESESTLAEKIASKLTAISSGKLTWNLGVISGEYAVYTDRKVEDANRAMHFVNNALGKDLNEFLESPTHTARTNSGDRRILSIPVNELDETAYQHLVQSNNRQLATLLKPAEIKSHNMG